jgi:hypothetical protein
MRDPRSLEVIPGGRGTILIDELRRQHASILALASAVDDYMTSGELEQVSRTVSQLRNAVVAHLALEDSELYGPLSRAAGPEGDERPASIARTLSSNMQLISEAVLRFFDGFERSTPAAEHFERQWKTTAAALRARIQSEEQTVFAMFELEEQTAP